MKTKTVVFAIALILFGFSLLNAESPKIKNSGNGILSGVVVDERGLFLMYVVDTKAQLCFAYAGNGTMSMVPCKNLVAREEWKESISWDPKN